MRVQYVAVSGLQVFTEMQPQAHLPHGAAACQARCNRGHVGEGEGTEGQKGCQEEQEETGVDAPALCARGQVQRSGMGATAVWRWRVDAQQW